MDVIKKYLPQIIGLIMVLVITALAVGYFGGLFGKAKGSADSSMAMLSGVEESEFGTYNGAKKSGSEVLSAATIYAGNPSVGVLINNGTGAANTFYVKNSAGTTPYYTPPSGSATTVGAAVASPTLATTLELGKIGGNKWLNPSNTYLSEIFVDTAGKVVLIRFTLQ